MTILIISGTSAGEICGMISGNQKGVMSWKEYQDLVNRCAAQGRTTGPEQNKERISATRLNAARMRRIYRTALLDKSIGREPEHINCRWKWTVIVEAWCGDGAQIVPYIAGIAELHPSIELGICLRDSNPELMERFLTDGKKSIPILICEDAVTGELTGRWGPRPAFIQRELDTYGERNPGMSHERLMEFLHNLYFRDNGRNISLELSGKLREWKEALECV